MGYLYQPLLAKMWGTSQKRDGKNVRADRTGRAVQCHRLDVTGCGIHQLSCLSPLLLLYAVDQDVVLNYIVPALWLPTSAAIPTMIAMGLSSETLSPQ